MAKGNSSNSKLTVHRSFVAMLTVVRQLNRKSPLNPFSGFGTTGQLTTPNHLKGRIKAAATSNPDFKFDKYEEIVKRLTEIGIHILTTSHKMPVQAMFVSGEACFCVSDWELFVDFSQTPKDAIRLAADPANLLRPFCERWLKDKTAKRLGLENVKPIGQILDATENLTLFELLLLSADFDVDWSNAGDFGHDELKRLKRQQDYFRSQLTDERVAENRKLISTSETATTDELTFDFSGDWDVQAAELSINQSSFDNLLQLQEAEWEFLNTQIPTGIDAFKSKAGSSPIDLFNKSKSNLPTVARLFRGTIQLLKGVGIGEHAKMTVNDSRGNRLMRYKVENAKTKGRIIEAGYEFEELAGSDSGGNGKVESYGEFKLTAVTDEELRGFYVGYEPNDMAQAGFPKRSFPIVFGILKVVRPAKSAASAN